MRRACTQIGVRSLVPKLRRPIAYVLGLRQTCTNYEDSKLGSELSELGLVVFCRNLRFQNIFTEAQHRQQSAPNHLIAKKC